MILSMKVFNLKQKFSVLLLCSLFAVFLAFALGFFLGHGARGYVVIKGDTASGLWPVAVKPVEKDIEPVDLNTATKEEIMTIPGIGESYADKILSLRQEQGRFTSVWDLDVIPGIGEAKLAQISPYVKFS